VSKIEDFFHENNTDFQNIWKRVSRIETTEQQDSFEEKLASQIETTACAAAYTLSLSKMFSNPGRNVLQTQANTLRLRLKQLRTEFFLKTGENVHPKASPPPISGKPASIRILYKMSEQSAASLLSLAETASEEDASALRRYAADDRRHCAELRELLLDCL